MPKIRKKQTQIVLGEYNKKSGVLTNVFRKIIRPQDVDSGFFTKHKQHESYKFNKQKNFYVDDYTIEFVEKNINPILLIDENHLNVNNLLHTPNEFNFDNTKMLKVIKNKSINNVIKENYKKTEYVCYKENTCLTKDDLVGKKQFIKINLNFNETCQLSFNKISDPISKQSADTVIIDNNLNDTVTINDNTFTTTNSPTAYFNFKENTWDYLGNINDTYFDSFSDFLNAPVGFNSIKTNKQSPVIKNQNVGHPINTLGFPFDKKFKGMNRHLLRMSDYITQPFMLKEIKINFIGSSYAEIEDPIQSEVLNSLNFFILNQRRGLNEDSFDQINKSNDTVYYYNDSNDFDYENISYSVNDNLFYSNIINHNTDNENIFVYLTSKDDIENNEKEASIRELVGYASLVNFCSGSLQNLNVDLDAIKNNADFFIENTDNQNEGIFSSCNYSKRNITLKSTISVPASQVCEEMSKFSFKPESDFLNRTGCNYRSERSEFRDVFSGNDYANTHDDFRIYNYNISKNAKKENGYYLDPSDTLLLGVSFSPNADIAENNLYGKDIYLLHDGIEIIFIGEYTTNNNKFEPIETDVLENKYLKKIQFKNNCYDNFGINIPYLNKNSYYDLLPSYNREKFFDLTQENLTFYNSISDANVLTNKTFTQVQKFIFDDSKLIDDLKYETKEYNLRKFGQMADNLFYTTSSAKTINNVDEYYILKEFRNDFYDIIDPVKTYNTDIYSRFDSKYFIEN